MVKVLAELSVHVLAPSLHPTSSHQSQAIGVCLAVLRRHTGIRHQVHALGTNLEGDPADILAAVRQCEEALTQGLGLQRVMIQLRMDCRRDHPINMEEAVEKAIRASNF